MRFCLLTIVACILLMNCGCSSSPPGPASSQSTAPEQTHSSESMTELETSTEPNPSSCEVANHPYPVYKNKNELVMVADIVDIAHGDQTARFGGESLELFEGEETAQLKYTESFHECWGPTGTEFAKITSFYGSPQYFYQNDVFLYLFFSANGGMDYNAAYMMCLNYTTGHFTNSSLEFPWEELVACEQYDGLLYVCMRDNHSGNPNTSFRIIVFDPRMDGLVPVNAEILHNELYDFSEVCESFSVNSDGVHIRFFDTEYTEVVTFESTDKKLKDAEISVFNDGEAECNYAVYEQSGSVVYAPVGNKTAQLYSWDVDVIQIKNPSGNVYITNKSVCVENDGIQRNDYFWLFGPKGRSYIGEPYSDFFWFYQNENEITTFSTLQPFQSELEVSIVSRINVDDATSELLYEWGDILLRVHKRRYIQCSSK